MSRGVLPLAGSRLRSRFSRALHLERFELAHGEYPYAVSRAADLRYERRAMRASQSGCARVKREKTEQ